MNHPAGIVICQPIIYLPDKSRIRTQTNGAQKRQAVFLDRDGTIVEDIGYLTNISDIKILRGVEESIRLLQGEFLIIIITNQAAVARGLINEDDLLKIHQALVQYLELKGATIDAIYSCPHHPEEGYPPYRIRCNGRKPESGMLQKAADQFGIQLNQSYLIGDKSSDILAGQRAGVSTTILVRSPKTELTICSKVQPTFIAKRLREAVALILMTKRSDL